MILADLHDQDLASRIGGRASLDDLFRRNAERRPDALALVDPPNREAFTGGPPRRMTYAQTDHVVSALAGRLRRLRLHTDSLVAFQVANSVESVLTLLAILRAGLIAMPLPLLWRRADLRNVLSQVGARALIVSGHIGGEDHFDIALQAAADVFSIRYVCGFGPKPPDGVVGLDDLFDGQALDPLPSINEERDPPPSAHLATVTFDLTAEGLVPVARSHAELVAAGLAVLLEGSISQEATILSTVAMTSFGGLAVSVVPWLLCGGTLILHQPFEAGVFAAQCLTGRCDSVIVPGPMIGPLVQAGRLAPDEGVRRVIGLWRAPERLAHAPPWREPSILLTDVQVFGEVGLIAARRGHDGLPAPVAWGSVAAPRGVPGAPVVAEIRRTERGTLAISGPMVPRSPFPPGVEDTPFPAIKVSPDGFIDTGYACRSGQEGPLASAPPAGIVSVGGYRFVAGALQQTVLELDADATLAALPDALCGHRLAGAAGNPDKMRAELAGMGLNPLIMGAFRAAPAASPTGR
jgi:AMP-binding enzyme